MNKKMIVICIIGIFLLTGLTTVPTTGMKVKLSHISSATDPINTLSVGSNCAVIVCGGYKNAGQKSFERTANHAVEVFESKGYIVFPLYQPTNEEVKRAITEWIPNNIGDESQKVVLYFIDHGSLEKGVYLNPNRETLTPSNLSIWVDAIEHKYSICTIVIEACHTGIFITPKLSKENRIIITATDDGVSYIHRFKESFFSKYFLDALDRGESYGSAWESADGWIDSRFNMFYFAIRRQNPMIDDSGNGYGVGTKYRNRLPMSDDDPECSEKDGILALGTFP